MIETNTNKLFNLRLINIMGQNVYYSIFNSKAEIDMSGFPTGLYIIQIFNDKDFIFRKIVKQ